MRCKFAALSLARLSLALVLLAGGTAASAAAEPFYAGKVVTIVVGSTAGSIYDTYVRVLAQVLPDFIPGHPTIVVENMPGANGDLSVKYMFGKAPQDGTYIASGVSVLPTRPLMHPDIATFDVNKLAWLGSITKDVYVAYVWRNAPVQTYEAAKEAPAIMGGIAIGAPTIDLAVLSNALFGTKFKIVSGYESESAVELAIEKGELQGSFAGGYSGLKAAHADWIRDDKIKIILQHGLKRLADLPDVPLFIDQAKNPQDREALQFLLSPQAAAKPFYAPPNIPADRLDLLRRAFDSTIASPEFLAAAAKAHIEVFDPMNGAELSAAVAKVTATPEPVVDRIRGILASYAP
jgi:tripartite-type tricarboxylate transporter receptor subunit TctC